MLILDFQGRSPAWHRSLRSPHTSSNLWSRQWSIWMPDEGRRNRKRASLEVRWADCPLEAVWPHHLPLDSDRHGGPTFEPYLWLTWRFTTTSDPVVLWGPVPTNGLQLLPRHQQGWTNPVCLDYYPYQGGWWQPVQMYSLEQGSWPTPETGRIHENLC